MKKIAVICLLLVSLRASGDLVVVEQSVVSRHQPQTITVKTKGDKCRIDYTDRLSYIYNLATGDSIRVDHSLKTFVKVSASQLQALKKALEVEGGATTAKPPKIVDTGKSEKLNGYDAEIYTAQTPAATYTFWVVKDYPGYAALNEEIKKIQAQDDVLGQMSDLSLELPNFDGMLIQSEKLSSSGQLTAITLVSAKIRQVDDVEFQPPAGYKDVTVAAAPAPKP